jgi:hypothetical protein
VILDVVAPRILPSPPGKHAARVVRRECLDARVGQSIAEEHRV